MPPHTQLVSKRCQRDRLTSHVCFSPMDPELKRSDWALISDEASQMGRLLFSAVWTHPYSVFRSWNCTFAAACSLWCLTGAWGRLYLKCWQVFLAERTTSATKAPWRDSHMWEEGPVGEDFQEFIELRWHGWLEGRVGSSYPVSKKRPVSPWPSAHPQTQHERRNGLWCGTECH